jgi:hypothetical protein
MYFYRVFAIWNPPLKFGEGENAQGAAGAKIETGAEIGTGTGKEKGAETGLGTAAGTGMGTGAGAGESAVSSSSSVSSVSEKKIRKTVYQRKSRPGVPAPPVNIAVSAVNTSTPATAILCPISATAESARSSVLFALDEESLCEEEETQERDGMAEFLDGCEDRPATLSSNCVGYHRGWRRDKRERAAGGKMISPTLRVPLLLAPAIGDEKGKGTGKDVEGVQGGVKRLSESEYTRSRLSSIGEMSQLLTSLVKLRVRTLAFCGVRKLVELVLKYCLQSLKSSSSTEYLVECVASYRGTYCTALHCTVMSALYVLCFSSSPCVPFVVALLLIVASILLSV